MKVKACDLQLADVIRLPRDFPFNTAIVRKVDDRQVTLYRPYGVASSFLYTGGVICYMGLEEYPIWKDDQEYELMERKVLK